MCHPSANSDRSGPKLLILGQEVVSQTLIEVISNPSLDCRFKKVWLSDTISIKWVLLVGGEIFRLLEQNLVRLGKTFIKVPIERGPPVQPWSKAVSLRLEACVGTY